MSFYLSNKDYKEMIGIISGDTGSKKGNGASTTYLDTEITAQEPKKQQGIVADTVDAVQMGAWKGVSDIAHGIGALTGADWLHDVGDWAAKGADENLATMSDEMKAALNQNAFDGEGQGVRNLRWWAGNLGSLIGQNLDTALTLGAGKIATIGAKQAGKLLLKKEVAEEVGKTAVEQAAKRGIPQKYWNMVGITATMSAMSGGGRYGQKRDEVMGMTNEQLAQIPQFSDEYYSIADSEDGKDKSVDEIYTMAKKSFADKVGRDAALNPTAIATDLVTNAVSGLGGGFWGLGSPAKTIKGGLLKGAAVEGGTEAIQGIGEQYALNKADQEYFNPDKDLTEGMADNAINGAVLGAVFGSAMGGLDTHTDKMALNNQKRTLLNHINTGNDAVDNQLRNYVDMLNNGATELDDLVSASRVQALNNAGIATAKARQAAEEALAEQQAKAKFESDFFDEEQPQQETTSTFKVDPNLERALELHSILGQFRRNDLSRANEFIDTPTIFADEQARKDYVIGRAFDEVRNIAQSYGIDPKDGKVMRRWLEDYAEKAKEYANDDPQAVAPVSNLQSSANIAPEFRNGVVSGANDEIDVGNGNYQPFQYEVVDASTLAPTQQKDENQFRDRDRASSQAQINNIARNLDPRKLAASPTMDIGAPLLALDGKTIIAGNGRSMAIQQAYQEGGADGYRQFLQDNSAHFGIDPAQLSEMENPVLVRRLTSPVDIAQVAINSNEQGGMRMSDLEQAKVDARRLPSMDDFVANDDGDINSADNQYFISQFVKNQPENVRNELLDSRGNLSQTGVQRMRNAMLYEAYGDSQTLSRLIENTDQGAKNVLNALTSIAPKVAQAQQGIDSGKLSSDVNISKDVIQAVEKYNQLNSQGFKISDYLAQEDFVGDLSPEAREILTIFDENRRSGKRIAQVLGSYLNKAQVQGDTSVMSLFGDDATFDRLGTLQQAKNVSDDYRYSFAGENAKTANKDLLSKARAAIESGKDAELVRQDTGWFKGSDGKWRFELDDSEITFKTKNIAQSIKGGVKLGDLINAEKLFNAYPGLKDVAVKESQSGTYYSPRTNEIFFNTNESSNSIKGDLLHEVQHAIQRVENFATGGSPKQFSEKVIDRNKILSENEQHFASVSFNKLSAKGKEYARAINRGENVEENYRLLSNNPNDKANWADYLHRINSANEYRQLGADLSVISPLEQYRQLAGEVEARNVESRLSFTDQQRKEISPKTTQDINDQNQVIHYTNGENYTLTESDIAEIEKAQAILNQTFGKAAEHIEVATFANPPKDVRHLITSDVEGWFNPKTGKVTLIADSINATKTMSKEERLQFVAWHEMAHRGINVGYKGSYDSLMQEVGKNKAISQIADAIQAQRKNTDDLAATNRSVAIEEAIAEMMAAHETGKWNELESRYGVEIKKGQRKSTKSWLAMTAQRIKDFLSKFFGVERAAQFSDEDVLNLISRIKNSSLNETGENSDVRFSRNEELTEERYNQAKSKGETELTFKQWQQVRSPEFKAWFGDWENDPENASKVVNPKTGEPLVVYHGTNAEFTSFDKMKAGSGNDKGLRGKGFYLSPNPMTAANYGKNVIDEFVSIRNPFNPFDFKTKSDIASYLNIDEDIFSFTQDVEFKVYQSYSGTLSSAIKDAGHDGVIYLKRQEVIAFEPNQIKSATDNTGAFSKENDDIRFSRANTMQSALDLAMTGVAHSEPTVWDSLKSKDFSGFKERFNRAIGKVDEWLADSLRPVNDWIDSMHLEDQTGNTSSRDHEKRRLKDAMYTAKGKRDALNSELEQAYLKPILSKIAALSKETKKSNHYIDELTMKRMVGNWISARYSIEKNLDLLARDEKVMRDTKRLLDNAKQNGTSAEVRRLNEAYLKAKEQYDNRKADIYNTDYKNKGNRFKVGVAGGWSIPEAELIMSNTEKHISRSNLESVAELVYDLNQSRLDIDRASGRYTEAEYQEYKANRHYVPLTGDPNADVDVDIISGAGSNALNIARDKTLKGRTSSEAEDAIDAVWKSIGKSTTYAGFAEFKSKIDDLFETEVTLLKDKGYSDAEAREQATANLGISKRKMQGLTRSSDNVLIRKEGSDYYEYELPTQVMESLRNDNVEHANAFLKVISKPTGWYARGVTQWTVTFAPMNMMRDTWEKSEFIRVQKLYDKNNRLVDSKTMDKIGRDTIKNALADKEVWQATKRLGFGQELRDSVPAERMLKQLLKEGGVSNYGTYLDKSEVDLIKKLRKENNPMAGKLEKVGKVLEGYNKMFDTVSALASYKALVENGIDSKQAAATTLELTNFRKTGSKMRGIKALYMFSQPTVMGAANLMRYLSTRKGQIRFAAYMAAMTSLYTVLRSMDDEDEGGNKMDQLGDITRYIPIPLGDGKYFKIPVGFGMAQMAWNFSTNIVKGAVGDISLTEAGANMLVHSLKTFSPVSPSEISAAKYPMEKITLTATPSILQPVMQNVLNRSAFGNKITTNYVRDDKLKAEQSKATTAQFWKDTAIELNDTLGIDMHPEQIKNLFDGYSSMFGSLKELNTVFVENPNREDLGRKTRTPFLNQFIGTTNEFAIQSRYYEASDEAKSVYNEYKSRKERNELGDWLDADKMKLIKFHEEEESVIKKARSEKAKLTRALRSGNISAVAYENGIKRYNKEMSAVQAKLLRKYRQMEGLNTH